MRALLSGLLCVATAATAQGLDLQPPAGFDQRLWDYMTRDQQIEIVAGTESAQTAALKRDTEQAAMEAVKSKLNDPDSAKFRDVKRLGPLNYCGWVNAKNGFGGYVGYSLFFANSKWTIIAPRAASDPALNVC